MNQCDKCGAKDRHEDKNSEFNPSDFFWHGDIEEPYDMGDYSCLCRKCFDEGKYYTDCEVSGKLYKGMKL